MSDTPKQRVLGRLSRRAAAALERKAGKYLAADSLIKACKKVLRFAHRLDTVCAVCRRPKVADHFPECPVPQVEAALKEAGVSDS